SQDRKECVHDESSDRGPSADATDQGQRDQETEERQARDRLHDVRESEHGTSEPRSARQCDAKRNSDRDGKKGRSEHEKHVLSRQREDFGAALPEVAHDGAAAGSSSETNWRTKSVARAFR